MSNGENRSGMTAGINREPTPRMRMVEWSNELMVERNNDRVR
jgi:hypothetical protein